MEGNNKIYRTEGNEKKKGLKKENPKRQKKKP